jgi:hypothetical protein
MANSDHDRPQSATDAVAIPLAAELFTLTSDEFLKLFAHTNLDESQVLLLLGRKDLSAAVLEEICRHRDWLRSYRVKRALAFHPHVPRTRAVRLVRALLLVDLVKLSLAPTAVADLRRLAEDQVLSRLGEISLGEKLSLSRRASARVLAALIAQDTPRLFDPALRNSRLAEAQILKLLANHQLPERVVVAIGSHPRWEPLPNVRLALVRHPNMPQDMAVKALPQLTMADLNTLLGLKTISAGLRKALESELKRRESISRKVP